MGTNYNGRIPNIPDIPDIEMPDMVSFGGLEKVFEETERSLEKTRLEMEQYKQKMLDSGNMINYIDESGFHVQEVISEDKSFKIMTKSRYLNGEYEKRLTIWKDGKIIRDDVEKSSIDTSDLHKKSGGGCLTVIAIILIIIVAVILIF